MLRCRSSLFALLLVSFCAPAQAQAPYYPDAAWQRKTAAEAGIDAQRLKDAVAYAVANETRNPRNLTLNHYRALTPRPAEPGYGFMNWYNNRDGKLFPSTPASAFAHIGNGTNIVYVDPDHDVVAVVRWIERRAIDEFVKRLLAAVGSGK